MDCEANTKNKLVRRKTDIITSHIYRAQSTMRDEDAVEWTDGNDEVVPYEARCAKKRKLKLRTKSEAAGEYTEVIDGGG